jgi:hypothetical protein
MNASRRRRGAQLALFVVMGTSLACGGKLPDPAGPQSWAAGQPIFVDDHLMENDLFAVNLTPLSDQLRRDLTDLGFSVAASPSPRTPLVRLEDYGRNDVKASLLLDNQVLETYAVDMSACTSAFWGQRSIADANRGCFARGLSLRLAASNQLKRIYAEQRPSAAPATPAVAAPAPPPAPSAPTYVAASPQPTAYAVVIGIERYLSGLTPPIGARGDATRVAEVLQKSLGLASGHIQVLLDEAATKGAIERSLAWAQASTPPGGRVYFYFGGHGAPDAGSGASYIVPSDGDPQYLDATALAMGEVLDKLSKTKAREALALVDACFSGAGGRSVLPPGARPLMAVRAAAAPAQVALFSASGANEISGPAPGNAGGGLFTSYLVDALATGAADINGDGQISLGELQQWVAPRVARVAQTSNRAQNPALIIGADLGAADGVILEWGLSPK